MKTTKLLRGAAAACALAIASISAQAITTPNWASGLDPTTVYTLFRPATGDTFVGAPSGQVPTNCGSSSYYLVVAANNPKEIFATIVAARSLGLSLSIYADGSCAAPSGETTTYPTFTTIQMGP